MNFISPRIDDLQVWVTILDIGRKNKGQPDNQTAGDGEPGEPEAAGSQEGQGGLYRPTTHSIIIIDAGQKYQDMQARGKSSELGYDSSIPQFQRTIYHHHNQLFDRVASYTRGSRYIFKAELEIEGKVGA